jgi:alpha-L-fucosidase
VIREDLTKGQHCSQFRLLLMNKKHELIREIKGTTIGRKRILTFPEIDAAIIALAVDEQQGTTAISEIEIYNIDSKLIEK